MKDYYLILGVSKTATDAEIKSAYRTLTLKFHPDRNPNNQLAKEQFLLINEAYDVLSNLNSRRNYDLKICTPRANKRPTVQTNAPSKSKKNKLSPEIDFFIGDKKEVYLGEEITFSWRCSHADSAYLYPIGLVALRGSKTIRFTKWDSPTTKIELTAYNTEVQEKTTQTILIENIDQMPIARQKEIKFKRRKKWLYERRYSLVGVCFLFFSIFSSIVSGWYNRMETIELYCGDKIYTKQYDKYNEKLRAEIFDKVYAICEQDISPQLKDQLIQNYLKFAPEE